MSKPNPDGTEDALALSFEHEHADKFRYNATRAQWLYWNGVTWAIDETGLVLDQIREHLRSNAGDRFLKASSVHAIATLCRSSRTFACVHSEFDADPWMLGTPGGTVNLTTGQLAPPNPLDLISRSTSVAPKAGPPLRLLKFLHEATGGDVGMIRYLQQICGYGLTGSTREQVVFFIFGDGGTGKSTFTTIVTTVAGTYAKIAPMTTFSASSYDGHPTEIASLAGARLVAANETEQGRQWASAKLKQLSGGDHVTTRFMRQNFFTFRPEFKLLFVGNFAPNFEDVDDAIKRRFFVIPFDVKPSEKDEKLIEALGLEAPQILQWMIEGCLDWQRHGLVVPEKVAKATNQYFDEQDLFKQWIESDLDRTDPKAHCLKTDATKSWNTFRSQHGEAQENSKALHQRLRKVRVNETRVSVGQQSKRAWVGIKLRATDDGRNQ